MASYEQVVKFENDAPKGMVRLVESNGFYRAYNHSAFLFHQVIAQHKVTRKFAKNLIVADGFMPALVGTAVPSRPHSRYSGISLLNRMRSRRDSRPYHTDINPDRHNNV